MGYDDGEGSGLETVVDSAVTYVRTCAESTFDIILVDCFVSQEELDPEMASAWTALLYGIRKSLSPSGVAAFNALHNAHGERTVSELRRYDGPLFEQLASPQLHMVPCGPCQKIVAAVPEGGPSLEEEDVRAAGEAERRERGFEYSLTPTEGYCWITPSEVW
eukprot:TRINITY_DN13088_c0_g1_i2.p2 TRINITY_DN13088_c0_g1~~TRINITY_DN13088_c0_g1_i2.p2  ORF type:complete len:162 (+),score=44.32 TRINITY_DN13088_c0_g1_i2:554-1039(+)